MKYNKFMLILLLSFIFSMAFVNAESPLESGSLGTFKQGDTFNLTNFCSEGGCSGITLTTITYPNGSTRYINEAMTFLNQEGYYEFNDSNTLGIYRYCTMGSNSQTNCATFEVTPNGEEFNTQKSISYLGFIVIFLFVFGMTLYGAIRIPWSHKKDPNNIVLQANNLRYVKIFLFSMSYMLMMFLFGLSYKFFNEAGIEGFNNFFYWAYTIFQSLLIPILIGTIIIFVIIFLTNKKITNNIKLGIN